MSRDASFLSLTDNEPSEMFAPLESDLEESAKSLLEPQVCDMFYNSTHHL